MLHLYAALAEREPRLISECGFRFIPAGFSDVKPSDLKPSTIPK